MSRSISVTSSDLLTTQMPTLMFWRKTHIKTRKERKGTNRFLHLQRRRGSSDYILEKIVKHVLKTKDEAKKKTEKIKKTLIEREDRMAPARLILVHITIVICVLINLLLKNISFQETCPWNWKDKGNFPGKVRWERFPWVWHYASECRHLRRPSFPIAHFNKSHRHVTSKQFTSTQSHSFACLLEARCACSWESALSLSGVAIEQLASLRSLECQIFLECLATQYAYTHTNTHTHTYTWLRRKS